MKSVISISRRTDIVAFFPAWLADRLKAGNVRVLGPSRHIFPVNLAPESVHTLVFWSKNFANLLNNVSGLRELLSSYDQLYCHFTITGLGGTAIERGTPEPEETLGQLPELVELVGNPLRISLRFDPLLYWTEEDDVRTNEPFFARIAAAASEAGIRDIRFSFTQWYRKAKERAHRRAFSYCDPPEERKKEVARALANEASKRNLRLYACSQEFLNEIEGIRTAGCIDGALLEELHPRREPVARRKDRSQRKSCRCTESKDVGSYTQICPHCCVYCYANPAS